MYDFVVVGAGPAGSRFARRAAEEGYDVLAFEQGEVGEPLACSGHVSTDIWGFTGENARDELLQNEIVGARFHVGGPGSDAHRFYKREVVSNVIDREGLDRHLAGLARDAGADVREHHTVTAVDQRHDRVAVTVRGPDGTETFEAKMIAGCDGPRSRVRTELDLAEPGELLHGVLGFDSDADATDYVDVHLSAPRFFAWRIPRGDAGVEYGLAAPPGDDVGGRFDDLIDGYGVDLHRRCSGAIPIGPPESVTSHRGFLLGDAAAQTKPFTGGGILYGMTSADHAVREIDPDSPASLAAYERAWRDDLSQEIRLGHWLRRAYSLPEPVQRAGLSALSGEIGVHMDRPSSLFSREHLRKVFS
ncbi:geranylgeranyl reductase family protein [Halostella sp. PRR32]|uniref:geranylgeranyl reductase family protein n=1 Tax=Halostella sp. PRR32 TaxID=3098147 RepID=UPI002B1D692B|nr:geranylgeranyl reductase family protein [Halostella sp. PRR32]